MTIAAYLPRGRGARVVVSSLVVASLVVPAAALAANLSFSGGDGADRIGIAYQAFDQLRVTRENQQVRATQVHAGDAVAVGTVGGNDRVVLDEGEDFALNLRTGFNLGSGDDELGFGLAGTGRHALNLRGGDGDDRVVGDMTSFDRWRADAGAGDDTSVLRIRGDSNVVDFTGGPGHDLWGLHNYGDTNRLRVDGGAGDDLISLHNRESNNNYRLSGGLGDDILSLTARGGTGLPVVRAQLGAGDDRVQGRGAMRAVYDGGRGNDDLRHRGGARAIVIRGGAGDDLLLASGAGDDSLEGIGGDDRIVATGGGRDKVTCGSGNDTVVVDDRDIVASDCERRVPYIDLNDPAKG